MNHGRIEFTTDMDQKIIQAYTGKKYGDGAIVKLQGSLGLSSGTLHYRAMKLGVATVKRSRMKWSDKQLKVLEDFAHLPVADLQKKFYTVCRVKRTATSIKAMMDHQGLRITQSRLDAGIYPAAELARLMGVAELTPVSWIKNGLLTAIKRPGVNSTEYEITEDAIRTMLINHTAAFNFSRIDKYWLVDVLSQQTGAKKP